MIFETKNEDYKAGQKNNITLKDTYFNVNVNIPR